MNYWIQTTSGRCFDLINIEYNTIRIEDIANALSNTCRFGGHTLEFYSVAQHCVLASHTVSPENALAALMHDAAEAFLGDIPSPLKALLPDYRALEKRVEYHIFTTFGLLTGLPKEIKEVDLQLLATEKRDLLNPSPSSWSSLNGVKPLPTKIVPWTPSEAYNLFMDQYNALISSS